MRPKWTGLPASADQDTRAQRRASAAILRRFGYLQLDAIGVAGARSHALVPMSRLRGLRPEIAENLLRPKAPLFEYWGHEVSWIPMELYPVFEFRRRRYQKAHPWWGPVVEGNRGKATAIRRRIREEGPLRSADFDDDSERSDWGFNLTKRLLHALWSAGELAIRERRRFHRYFDLTERVIPKRARQRAVPEREAIRILLLKALDGHGWAQTKTLAATWRFKVRDDEIPRRLEELREGGEVVDCALVSEDGDERPGWIRPEDLELAARLRRLRPRSDTGVLLSPFDPILWDRDRARALYDFDAVMEIFKPVKQRKYGYYCMPVLAGESLVARCDVKADRSAGKLNVLSTHYECEEKPVFRKAVGAAIARLAKALALRVA